MVESADVILQVLDARDPLGTRSKPMEKSVVGQSGKRLVLVINKADLVPKENLEKWLKYLRREFPTVVFKSSTQSQNRNLGQMSKKVTKKSAEDLLQTSKSVGAATLMALLGNYCRNKDVKTSIRVGVVGFPNVGKSSLINSLKRSRVCNTGNTPGVTKSMQEIQLDSKIKLFDCPGMILNDAKETKNDAQAALRNAVKIEQLDDLETPVEAILQRCQPKYLQLQYDIVSFENVHEFLALVARANGKLKKGGMPDKDSAARKVLQDWNCGKIKYYTEPPETETNSTEEKSEIVSQFAAEFNLDSLDKMMEMDCQDLPDVLPSQTTKAEEEEQSVKFVISDDKRSKKMLNRMEEMEDKLGANAPQRLKKANKMREKKEKKDRRRREKVGEELADIMDSAM